MESILKDRLKDGVRQFLVKWEGYDATHNSWEPASNFISPKIIENYWENKHKKKSTRTAPKINFMTHLLIISIFILVISVSYTEAIIVKDTFKFCTHSPHSEVLNTNKLCEVPALHHQFLISNFTILEKRSNIIDGYGYMCSRAKIIVTTHKTWDNEKKSERSVIMEKLSSSDCLALLISKNCQGQIMTGMDDSYKSIVEPTVEYSYFGAPRIFTSYHCHVFKRIIIGSALNHPLFQNSLSRCWPTDLFCQLDEEIIIWEKNIIHECPFFRIRTVELKLFGSTAIGENLLFQIIDQFSSCNLNILSTSEGLFLSNDTQALLLEVSNLELDMKNHFILAELDSYSNALLEIINKNFRIQMIRLCELIKYQLLNQENISYSELRDHDDHSVTIYKEDETYKLTNCVKIIEINVNPITKYCYKHIPVTFKINNLTINGFLRNNYLLTIESQEIDCSRNIQISLDRTNKVLTSTNNRINLTQTNKHLSNFNLISLKFQDISHFHNHEIVDQYNLYRQIEKLTRIDDSDGTFHVMPKLKTSQDQIDSLKDQIK